MFDMVFLSQYHLPASNMIRLVRQDITEDGKKIGQYENNKKRSNISKFWIKKGII